MKSVAIMGCLLLAGCHPKAAPIPAAPPPVVIVHDAVPPLRHVSRAETAEHRDAAAKELQELDQIRRELRQVQEELSWRAQPPTPKKVPK